MTHLAWQFGPLVGVAALALLAAVAVGSHVSHNPPPPQPASAPADQFSASRAIAHVEQIAAEPHPVGSEANARARNYITGHLRVLGLEPAVFSGPVVRGLSVGFVENIHARIPGRASTGAVVLVAHYDSVPGGPGAADDGAGVAAILETARAILAGPRLRNDIHILVTDGEEPGLLGAHAFVESGMLDPERSVILNLEARGTSGPLWMFETSDSNADLIAALSTIDDPPIAASMTAAFYQMLQATGANTDFTTFREAGFKGMNFAITNDLARYHTTTDSVENLDPASLQHHGQIMLALTRSFGGKDIDTIAAAANATYFTVLGRLVSYPVDLATPLALLAGAGYAATLWYARRRKIRLLAVGAAAASLPVAMTTTAALAFGAWWALGRLRSGYLSLAHGMTYQPHWYQAAFVLMAITVTVGWYLLLRRRLTPTEVSLGVLGWLTIGAVTAGFLLPDGAYLFTWPAVIGSVGLALALRLGDQDEALGYLDHDPPWACHALTAAAALPAAALLAPIIDFQMGFALAAAPLSGVVMVAGAAMPLVGLTVGRRLGVTLTTLAVSAIALFGVGLVVDGFDSRNPRLTSLVYLLDADQGEASWASKDPVPAPWTAEYVGGQPAPLDDFPSLGSRRYRTGPAPVACVAGPSITVTETREEGQETVFELLVDAGGASRVDLFADTSSHAVTSTDVAGLPLEAENHIGGTSRWTWGFEVHGPPAEGVEMTLRVRGDGPLPLRAISHQMGLPQLQELAPMPDHLIRSGSDFPIMAARTFHLWLGSENQDPQPAETGPC